MEYLHFEERVITSNWELRKMESHPYYEIYILLKGQRVLFLNNRMISVPESSILIIPPFMPHRTSGGAYHRINIWVSPSLLDKESIDFLEANKVPTVFTLNAKLREDLYSVLSSASSFKEDNHKNALKYKKSFFNVAFYYLKQCSICTENVLSEVKQEEKLLLPILTYINDNLSEKITVERLCEKFFCSRSYLYSKFKDIMGCSIADYLLFARINESKNMLTSTKKKLQIIADECGFSSLNYFSLIFKQKVGMSPSAFRKKYK
ncbi:MAG: helix-turn-helix transcriptional regulator [Clostridia bacterium]|nr:helix-turn-helix transcriptional regulator [Clostridia bacterium]